MVKSPGPKRGDDLIQAGANPRHLRLRDPRIDAEGSDQVVDGPGGDPADVGLHHHRIQRLVDAAAWFEDDRKERPLPQLRDPQLHVAGLGDQQPGGASRCARWSGSRCAGNERRRPVVGPDPLPADPLGCLGFNQLLHHHPNRLSDQIDTFAGPKTPRATQTLQTRTRPSVGSFFSECLAVHTEDPADGPHILGATPLTPNPHPWGRLLRRDVGAPSSASGHVWMHRAFGPGVLRRHPISGRQTADVPRDV